MSAGLKIAVNQAGEVTVVHLDGRLDAVTAPKLETALGEHISGDAPRIVIDFSQLEYLSSAGMRLLLSSTKKVAAREGKLVLCSLCDEVMEIIRMAGFERILHISPSEQAAIESMS